MKPLTRERLKELLRYNQETGVFTWIKSNSPRALVGSVAGNLNRGYIWIRLDKKLYTAHSLAFLYELGYLPSEDIDHINGDRSFNAWNNLREATRSENMENQRLPRTNNKSGFLGVSFEKQTGKYKAQIKTDGKTINLGRYDTPEIAHQIYLAEKREHHKFCTI